MRGFDPSRTWATPGQTYQDSSGQMYTADKNGALRRQVQKPNMAERKALKRARRDAQRQRRKTMKIELIQFQCQKDGTLFYYQHDRQTARSIVEFCPVCRAKQVKETGRSYSPIEESGFPFDPSIPQVDPKRPEKTPAPFPPPRPIEGKP